MSIYTKSISQLTPADLQELVEENAVEDIRLEFKLLVPNKEDTLKKLTSFANTFGGLMVIGARANSADGRGAVVSGCPACKKQFQSLNQFVTHLSDDVLPATIRRAVVEQKYETAHMYF